MAAPADPVIRRLAFLASAGEVLSASLDGGETLQQLARLAIPELGDFCVVDVSGDGLLRRVAAAHVDPAKNELLWEIRRRYPVTPDSPQPAARVLRTGQPELLPRMTPDMFASRTRDARHAEMGRALGLRSYLAVPMVARGAILGVMSLGVTESDRQFGADDLALARDLARKAALAVDNARLYQRAQEEVAERARAEQALRLSEERFRAMMEQAPLSIQIFDPAGATIRVNKAWEELWGVTPNDIPEYNVLHDPQLEALGLAPLVRRAFAGEPVEIPPIRYDPNATLPARTRHQDAVRWVRAFAYPVKDADGTVREVVIVHEDVTRARNAEERLRASEERLRLALEGARMNVWDLDVETGRVECSPNAREFWGIDVGTIADFTAVIHPDDRDCVQQAAQAALSGGDGYFVEYRLQPPGGDVRWVQSRGRVERTADGTPRRFVGVTLDITDLKSAEEATRLLADAGKALGASLDYRTTLQNLSDVVIPRLADWYVVDLIGESGTLERVSVAHPDPARVSQATELLTRYPPRSSDPYGPWHVLATGGAEWVPEITDEVLRAVAHDADHLAVLRELGTRSYVSAPLVARGTPFGVLTLVYAESGRRYRAADVALVTEVARRVAAAIDNARLYERLRTEDRRKDEFLATLAHELRNPLAPIRTGLALLRVAADHESAERTRQVMERQLGHMVRLIDDLLDLSRVTRGKVQLERERVDLWSIVASALETSRPAIDDAGLQLTVRLPEEPIVLDADRTRLAQVLSNLLNNAAKYTERGGRVELQAAVEGSDLVIRVADTGIGIPREMLGQIFEMFAQVGRSVVRSQGGLGIGLTLVRRLVELHGGRVWAESQGPGLGSTFIVRLPVAAPASPRPDAGAESPAMLASSAARRVLVVDDNADAAETLAMLLGLDGHDVRTAGTASAALEAVESFTPDVAFLDIGLPDMNGCELARQLRNRPGLAAMTLVAVTGWGQREDRRQSSEAGFDHHLTKPVDPRELQQLVARSLSL